MQVQGAQVGELNRHVVTGVKNKAQHVEEFNMHAVSDKQDKAQSLLNSARQNYFY
jgi:hypothetical protein